MAINKNVIVGASFIVLIMLFSGISAVSTGVNPVKASGEINFSNNIIAKAAMADMRMVPVEVAKGSVSGNATFPYNGNLDVMVTFSFQNESRLTSFLANLSNPNNPQYHKYLARKEFASEFSVSESEYLGTVNYFEQFSGLKVKEYADRVSLEISGPASEVGKAFNSSISTVSGDSRTYFATSSPKLPIFIASHVSEVTGLTNSKIPIANNFLSAPIKYVPKIVMSMDGGYPAPINSGAVQYIYGSDLQVAYDEQSLLNITYPTNEVIATILWAGTNSSGTPVGPFVPADIYAYYNATMPSYEPHSKVYGVPLNGAVKPGVSASYDVTGANQENTLDLEMVGSTAPGSSIYNVYGPNATYESLDSALAFILNPNSTYPALNNVSVISNSWGGQEFNNTVWYQYLQEAQARGITVLASSGDSGDNNASSKYTGAQLEFPSAMAYNNFGVTAVGGTTLTLAQNLHILNQTAWYISSSDSADGGPAGSVGGISTVFSEPSFQLSTEANRILQGSGRGVPDIAAIANNTIVYITIDGTSYYANPYSFWGTSIASPVEAGIVAEMDAVLNHYNQSNLGYLNPLIYNLANKQVTTPPTTDTLGFIPTGNYNSSLPTLPFNNVVYGRNHAYNASFGYNLVTGWGSIDAYNFSMYVLNINRSKSINDLRGVDDILSLNGLNVTSYLYDPSTGTYNILNTLYNASIQQNLFLANQFGAPIYWIQNVVYINGSQSLGWSVSYTGWVVYPFYGLYPTQTVYQYNFPLGKIISMPHQFNVKTWISNLSDPMHQTVSFEVNSQIISLPVPGAAYIIDSHNYSYTWQGHSYYNGPFPNNPYSGGLDPQFGLVGGPSGGLGIFTNPTSGTVSAYVEPMDQNSYISAVSKVFNLSVDETGETALHLSFAPLDTSTWSLSINNSSVSQGILDYTPAQYTVTFTETGLPSGTTWYVNLTNGQSFSSTTSTVSFSEPNGTYSYTVTTSDKTYTPAPSSGSLTVNGASVSRSITFSEVYTVTFTESGLSQGTVWWVNLTGHSYSSSSNTISFYESNGTYSYTLSTDNKNYGPSNPSGVFVVDGTTVSQSAVFVPVLYNVTFKETGLPSGMIWSVTSGSTTHSSTNSTISFKEMNGTYAFSISNLTLYYTNDYSISTTVNGKNLTETISFLHYAYITGTLSPGNATLIINGKTVSVSGGNFNVSVVAGNYTITATSNGYASYSNNITIAAGGVKTLNISLKSNSTPISPTLEYAALGAIVVVIAGVGVVLGIMRMRKR